MLPGADHVTCMVDFCCFGDPKTVVGGSLNISNQGGLLVLSSQLAGRMASDNTATSVVDAELL